MSNAQRIRTMKIGALSALTVLGALAIVFGGCSLWSSKSTSGGQTTEQQAATGSITTPTDRSVENQTLELKALNGPFIEQVGEEIKVVWESEALFDFDSAMLKMDATDKIDELSSILKRYPGTQIIITGHTDNEGSEDYNLKLSKRRAESLRDYLVNVGVSPSRINAFGLGARQPIAPNDTDEGRRSNRRIEITIRPDARAPGTENN